MDLQETILIVDDDPTSVDMLSQELEEESERWLTRREGSRAQAFSQLKRRLRAPARARLESYDETAAGCWLDLWFSPDTRARVAAARRALSEGRGSKPGDRGG